MNAGLLSGALISLLMPLLGRILAGIAVAAAAADTRGTEIGILSKVNPRLVTIFAQVETGRSGAVSPLGLLHPLRGTDSVFACAIPWLNALLPDLFMVAGGGLVRMMVDSF